MNKSKVLEFFDADKLISEPEIDKELENKKND